MIFASNRVKRRAVLFTAPGAVEVCTEEMAAPQGDELLIETVVSAISAGTEMLFYRGQVPAGMAADSSIAGLTDGVSYPLKYGYACVGRICEFDRPPIRQAETTEADGQIDAAGKEDNHYYFAFHPHESHFCASPQALLPVPEGIPPPQAALLPNAETAVNLVMDGAPLVGERVMVMGLGIVGLLTTALLAQFPLAALIAVDPQPHRRLKALRLGASQTIDPGGADGPEALQEELADAGERHGVDLIYEPLRPAHSVGRGGLGSRIRQPHRRRLLVRDQAGHPPIGRLLSPQPRPADQQPGEHSRSPAARTLDEGPPHGERLATAGEVTGRRTDLAPVPAGAGRCSLQAHRQLPGADSASYS